jgi:deazaflavin-dependent oxidoreductase (nitroreductase family)
MQKIPSENSENNPSTRQFPNPPRGIKAIPWRLPIWIYRLGLGSLMGNRFLLLNHTGRKSGQPRQAVLEIIRSFPAENRYLVVSGFGVASHWYQNIKKDPKVTIQVGRKKISAIAERLDPETAGETMVIYAQNNPGAIKTLSGLLGYEIDHTPDGYRSFGKRIPVIQFTPLI